MPPLPPASPALPLRAPDARRPGRARAPDVVACPAVPDEPAWPVDDGVPPPQLANANAAPTPGRPQRAESQPTGAPVDAAQANTPGNAPMLKAVSP